MNSGIYELVFADDVRYVGKSIDIEKRWDEHRTSWLRNKAAAKMMQAYHRYGLPDFTILARCHPDHIDILESFYIRDRNSVLNTSRPECINFESFEFITSDDNVHLLQESTVKHILRISEYRDQVATLENAKEILINDVVELSEARDKEEIEADSYARASSEILLLRDRLELRDRELKLAQQRIEYLELPWWKKLFS